DVRFAGYPEPSKRYTVVNAAIIRREGPDLVLSYHTSTGYSGGPVLRNDQLTGMIWSDTGGEGKAMVAENVKTYLDGTDVPWVDSDASPAVRRAPPDNCLAPGQTSYDLRKFEDAV